MAFALQGSRRAWRRASLVAAAFPPVAAAFLALRGAWKGWEELHPARAPVSPAVAHSELPGLSDVSLRTADGVKLHAWWRPGDHDAAVVLAHGWGANREQMLGQALALARGGFGVLLVDLRGHGASGGRANAGDGEQLDVQAATDFLARQPAVGWIGAVGYSLGGTAVGLAASGDPRIRAAVVEAAPPSLDAELVADFGAGGPWVVRSVRATMRLLGVHAQRVRLVDRVAGIAPRPLLLVYGERDELTAPAEARAIRDRAGGSSELWLVPGARHADLEAVAGDGLARLLTDFLGRAREGDRLGSGAPPGR